MIPLKFNYVFVSLQKHRYITIPIQRKGKKETVNKTKRMKRNIPKWKYKYTRTKTYPGMESKFRELIAF